MEALLEGFVSGRWRSAEKQVAHLFCEWLVRLQAVGLVVEDSFHLPITQVDLSDMTGLSPVHINRVLQKLRGQKLIIFRERRLRILNVKALTAFADFDASYLAPERGTP